MADELQICPMGRGRWAVFEGGKRISGILSRPGAVAVLDSMLSARRGQDRSCLRCGTIFSSQGPHNRMCDGCRTLATRLGREFEGR